MRRNTASRPETPSDLVRAHPIACFYLLACALSWLCWLPLAMKARGLLDASPSRYLHLLGGLGPMCAALLVTYASGDAAALRRLAERSLVPRGRALWIALSFLLPAALFLVSVAAIALFTDAAIAWDQVGIDPTPPSLPPPLFWLANVLFFGFGEEVGWRGFVLPRLQARRGALSSALLVGLAWAGWHLPLFAFSPGLSSLGLGGSVGWLMSILTGSVLMAWLFNSGGGSVLAVAIFHGVLDIFMTSPVTPLISTVMGAILTVGTIALVPLFGPTDLARRPRATEPVPQ